MILAPIPDFRSRSIVRRAALAEEDVFHQPSVIVQALQLGYPRLFLARRVDWVRYRPYLQSAHERVPALVLGQVSLAQDGPGWNNEGKGAAGIDESAIRLRALFSEVTERRDWVEGVFSDLTRILGEGLPLEVRGFFRRALEFPALYGSLRQAGEMYGLSPGALKARFRRRELPSPSTYLRWLRLVAAGRILADPEETVLSASYRMGFASDGNFCRWVSSVSGMNPSALRDWDGRLHLLIRLADECLHPGSLEKWRSFRGLFLRSVA